MNHHKIQYPPTNFYSDKYRSAGIDSAVILFTIAFSPLLVGLGLLAYFGVVSMTIGISGLAGLIIWGLMHSYIHGQFHLNNSFWNKFSIFHSWKDLHYIHHLNMNSNLGIFIFVWDKLFGTFEDTKHLPK
jgi:sterol desaturase/sphingolipid hydroxylase (fatty acid hydroxylase superfamily)